MKTIDGEEFLLISQQRWEEMNQELEDLRRQNSKMRDQIYKFSQGISAASREVFNNIFR